LHEIINQRNRLPEETKDRIEFLSIRKGIFDFNFLMKAINEENLPGLTAKQLSCHLYHLKKKHNLL